MNRDYFEGWYYKHQTPSDTLAVIPGRAKDGAFIQIITDNRSYNIPYPLSQYNRKKDYLRVGGSVFTPNGVRLDIQGVDVSLYGTINYKNIKPIHGDIMGPFRYFPMECRHGVVSMRHDLYGCIKLNGETFNFNNGIGYIESDRGCSFPKSYAWVQANDFGKDCSVMASVAEIPFMGMRFRGCICVVLLEGREYRLATYNGAKIVRCEPDSIILRRRQYVLDVQIDKKDGCSLNAPVSGAMNRVIKETAACTARFRFSEGNTVLFEGVNERTSHEYAPG